MQVDPLTVVDVTLPKKLDAHAPRLTETELHGLIRSNINIAGKLEVLEKKGGLQEVLRRKNAAGNTPLHLAAAYSNCDSIGALLRFDETLLGERNERQDTPLLLATRLCNRDAVRALIQQCDDASMLALEDANGYSALDIAKSNSSSSESREIVVMLELAAEKAEIGPEELKGSSTGNALLLLRKRPLPD